MKNQGAMIAMMWGANGMAAGGWIFMTVLWVVVIGAIVWAVAALFPRAGYRDEQRRDTPEDILDRRFAQGDLDAESYREMREELRGRSGVRN